MAMTRRSFIKSGTLATAALSGMAEECDPTTMTTTTGGSWLQFDFTGLMVFQTWPSPGRLNAILVDPAKAGVPDAHAPMLMMPMEFYGPLTDPDPYEEPVVVQMGGKAFATWSLFGTQLHVDGVQKSYGIDAAPALTLNETAVSKPDPDPIDSDAGWASLKWFVDLQDFAPPKTTLDIVDRGVIASQISLTRGQASGRSPVLCCAYRRKFRLGGGTERTCATHLKVQHPAASGGVTKLMVAPIAGGSGARYIPIKVAPGQTATLSISNNPLTAHAAVGHVSAYYKLVGLASGPGVAVSPGCSQCGSSSPGQSLGTTAKPGVAPPHAPDPDCFPMVLSMGKTPTVS